MVQVKIKRVYEPEEKQDGFRVLVDRLWPRGVKKESLRYDLWAKDIAPSTPLRKWYHGDTAGRWQEFGRKYTGELNRSPAPDDFIGKVKGKETVTLLYASRNTERNHAIVLRDFLKEKLG